MMSVCRHSIVPARELARVGALFAVMPPGPASLQKQLKCEFTYGPGADHLFNRVAMGGKFDLR